MTFQSIPLSKMDILSLKQWLTAKNDVFEIDLSSTCLSLLTYLVHSEVGGPNDEIARFLKDTRGRTINPTDLISEIGLWGAEWCVKVSHRNSLELSLSIPSLNALAPIENGNLYIRPGSIVSFVKEQGLSPIAAKLIS